MNPKDLPQFEDRVLYQIVELTGDRPVPHNESISSNEIAKLMAEELGIESTLPDSPDFHGSQARLILLEALDALDHDGLIHALKVMGPWSVRPTRDGRKRVSEWKENWVRKQETQDKKVRQRILELLDQERRKNPERYHFQSKIEVDALCEELGIDRNVYLANARRLIEQRKVEGSPIDQDTVANGRMHITEAGISYLEAQLTDQRKLKEVNELYIENGRLRQRLAVAERNLPTLIADEELRRRCLDLLIADAHYDRVIREASVILENRVRQTIGAAPDLVGVALMDQGFRQESPKIRLSDVPNEQTGAHHLYRGIIAFFRNSTGHHVSEEYSQEDALRFLVMVDLLLGLITRSNTKTIGTNSVNL